jgi:ribosome-binding protein aMBF1 (putative translation factor)
MKMPHTNDIVEITVHDKSDTKFLLSRKSAQKIFKLLKPFQVCKDDDVLVPADEVFKELNKKHGDVASTIRGFRVRDGMTQVELAKKLSIRQSHVSQIEHGKRVVGKKLAQKLAQLFSTHYQLFL